MKKSFILYLDQQELFNDLPDEVAGKLIKHIFSYVNCENPETDDLLLKVAFSSVKQALKRDLKKWDAQLKQRSEAGKKSAEARANKKQQGATESTSVESRSTKSTDSVNDSVSVSVSDKDSKKEVKPKKPSPSKIIKPDNVEEEVWQDWLTLRKTKRAPVTNTVLKGAIKQAGIAKVSLNEFLQIWCRRGSQGLEAAWIKPDEKQNQAPQMRPLNGTGQADTRSRAQKVSDKLDEIAKRDIEENGFTESLD
jgi:hypothetical protein